MAKNGKNFVAAGSKVATEYGPKPIEAIDRGDRVWSFNLDAQRMELCKVSEIHTRNPGHSGLLLDMYHGRLLVHSQCKILSRFSNGPWIYVRAVNLGDKGILKRAELGADAIEPQNDREDLITEACRLDSQDDTPPLLYSLQVKNSTNFLCGYAPTRALAVYVVHDYTKER